MSWSNIGALACQNLQTDLALYFGRNSPQFRSMGSTAFIKWLLSPQNTANFQRINVTSIPGKKRAVAFRLVDPYCFDLARATRACNDPAGTISQTPKEVVYDMDVAPYRIVDGDGDPVELKVDLEDLERFCQLDDMSWITDQINRLLLRYEQVLDKRLLELAAPLVGTNAVGDVITNINLWVRNNLSNTSNLNPEAQFYWSQLMQDMGIDFQYASIGGALLNKIKMFTGWAGLDAAGIDMSKVEANNPYLFYDRNADTVLGATDWLHLSPGAMQLVYWNRYPVGSSLRRQVTDLYSKGTVMLPTSGIEVDWTWKFDYQCDVWTFEPTWYGDIVTVPAGGCDMAGVNGMIRLRDCSGVGLIPPCPEVPAA